MKIGLDRQRSIQLVFLVCAVALTLKAAQLQLFDDSFRRRADATTIQKLTVYPPRGLVYDRKGRLIVNNEATYDLMVTYSQVELKKMDTPKFCNILGITAEEFKENLNKDWRSGKFSKSVPFVFLKKLSFQTYALLQESLYEFPGFFVQVRNIRGYPYHVGAHVLGYINEVDPRDIERGKGLYVSGDYIGSAGLESEYEPYLRGEKGTTSLLKDNLGRIVGKYKNGEFDQAATSGSDLISSINIDLQAYGEYLMQNKTGSIVAIEPKTGQILCMISAPTYDPNELTMTQGRGQVFSRLLTDPLKPFFDRTVMAKYPPGSIFKTVVSLIGMQEGTMNPEGGFNCNGGYFYAGRLYKCHHRGHLNNVVDAIAYSCNTFYMSEYRDIIEKFGFTNPDQGLDLFNKYMTEFGFGRQLGIDYPNESPGSFPTSAYYNRLYPKNLGGWRSPFIMSCGIGQGELQLTTLQMANLAACIANTGYWYAPHLAKEFRDGKRTERIAVSVDMLSTGYNCRDALNIGLLRPIFSPTEYIQIKGRGTRLYTFKIGNTEYEKKNFFLLDFCAVAEYFEEKYDYSIPLKLPREKTEPKPTPTNGGKPGGVRQGPEAPPPPPPPPKKRRGAFASWAHFEPPRPPFSKRPQTS